ncbi:MAG: DNA recombination protein RmuC [Pararhodobacter sp.]|nr:DNA recombination protein RmuC [Pararhodobacter sp.]
MENIDLTLIAIGLLAVLVVVALFRRPRGNASGADIAAMQKALADKDAELREAWRNANRFEALAGERKEEIDRLNGDLSKLRRKLEEDAEKLQVASSRISGLEAELKAERQTGEEREQRHRAAMDEKKAEAEGLQGRIRELGASLEARAEEQQRQGSLISRLQAELKAQQEAAAEKIEILSKVRADMEAKFHELARQALKVQGEEFSKANLEKLHAALTPLKEHVGHFERELKAVHKATVDDRAALKAEIQQLSKRSEEVSKEALALTRALKSDQQKQGAWGEMILESILERSGLREGEEYETQAHRTAEDGVRLRPDVVVRIPGGKTLIIDSKVSLVAYSEAVNAEGDTDAAAARKRHVISLRGHITALAEKGYHAAEDSSVDYVILFVPIEGALSEALREDGTLTEFALERHITIATPTTLMMALRTVAHVWAVERRNRNAEEIARRAGLLYDKVAGFVGNMEDVGRRLNQAQGAYDNAFGQLSRGRGNLLSQVETLKTLGAKTTKRLGVDFEDAPEVTEEPEKPLGIEQK